MRRAANSEWCGAQRCDVDVLSCSRSLVADNSDENRAFHVAAVLSICTKSFAISPQTPPAHGGGKRCPNDDSQPSGRMGVVIASDPAQGKWCKASCKRRACATVLLGAESAPLLHFLPTTIFSTENIKFWVTFVNIYILSMYRKKSHKKN